MERQVVAYARRLEEVQELEARRAARDHAREERLRLNTDRWMQDVLPRWRAEDPLTPAVEDLWREGLPPKVRERVWPLAIGNRLRITPELFRIHRERALQARRSLHSGRDAERADAMLTLPGRAGESVRLIPFDLPRTLPELAFFQPGGPRHDECVALLESFSFLRPDLGYVQGMSYLAAMLLLYMQVYPAFVALCNLLTTPALLGLYQLDPEKVAARCAVFDALVLRRSPALHAHFAAHELLTEMFLPEWFLTLFAKPLNLDSAAVVWDLFLLDGELALYTAALAILQLGEARLLRLDCLEDLRPAVGKPPGDAELLAARMRKVRIPASLEQEMRRLERDCIPGGELSSDPVRPAPRWNFRSFRSAAPTWLLR